MVRKRSHDDLRKVIRALFNRAMTNKPYNVGDCRLIIASELNKVVADPKMHVKDLIFAKQFRGLGNYSGMSSFL